MWVVRLAVGGVYGPFPSEGEGQAWGEAKNYGPYTVEKLEPPEPQAREGRLRMRIGMDSFGPLDRDPRGEEPESVRRARQWFFDSSR